MRTNLFRGMLAFAALLTLTASPALAQSIVKGKVLDAANKPVEGATVTFENESTNRKAETKTDKKGEFLQVGLATGAWKVTANKDGIGNQTLPANISQGRPAELTFHIAPGGAGGGTAADKAAQAALQLTAKEAEAALAAGRNDEAVAKYTELTTKAPTCADCYVGLGQAHLNKQEYDQAEAALKKAIEIKPEAANAYGLLSRMYNAQRKFDLAAEAGAKAAQISAAAPGGGASAEANYNQGVVLFNGGKFAEAKAQFESATKADPTYAPAFYQLGMTSLNLGQIPDAVAALEKYLQLDPNGSKAAEVKASLPALQAMLKK
jgi:tetratricopeptide (TPR) repeat protein